MTASIKLLVFAFPDKEKATAAFVQLIQLLNQKQIVFEASGLVVRDRNGKFCLWGISPSPSEQEEQYDHFVAQLIDICLGSQMILSDAPKTVQREQWGNQTRNNDVMDGQWQTVAERIAEREAVIIVNAHLSMCDMLTSQLKPFSAQVI